MARFSGVIGYRETVKTAPGVMQDRIVERRYRGDEKTIARKLEPGEKVNNDLSVRNSISIVADAYAFEHFAKIAYVKWAGSLWTVVDVEVQRPRLTLKLGGIYNEQVASGTPDTP